MQMANQLTIMAKSREPRSGHDMHDLGVANWKFRDNDATCVSLNFITIDKIP